MTTFKLVRISIGNIEEGEEEEGEDPPELLAQPILNNRKINIGVSKGLFGGPSLVLVLVLPPRG